MKKCTICNVEKSVDQFTFRKNKNNERRLHTECKDCLSNYKKEWYTKNKTAILLKRKEYAKENAVKIKKTRSVYLIKNKDKISKKQSEYEKNRKENDIVFKLRHRVSKAVYFGLHRNGGSKNNKSVLEKLTYTIDQLKQHLEAKFEPWMNWNNWGVYDPKNWDDNDTSTWTWQIDHIMPHSFFKYSDLDSPEFIKCWSLDNLRPIGAKQNNIKRANFNKV